MSDQDPAPNPETVEGEAAAEPKDGNKMFRVADLQEGIDRGDTKIMKVTLRKPMSGDLRGVSLQDLYTSQADAVIKIIPRISDPILTDHEALNIPPIDFFLIAGVLRRFFMTAAEKAAVDRMTEEQTSIH